MVYFNINLTQLGGSITRTCMFYLSTFRCEFFKQCLGESPGCVSLWEVIAFKLQIYFQINKLCFIYLFVDDWENNGTQRAITKYVQGSDLWVGISELSEMESIPITFLNIPA